MIAIRNTSSLPLVVTDAGRVLGSGASAAVDADARTQRLLDARKIVQMSGSPADDTDPDTADALRAAAPRRKGGA